MSDHPISITRGAWYLLERLLQDAPEGSNPDKRTKWARCWSFLRKSNTRLVVVSWEKNPTDFEKPVVPQEKEAQDAFARRVAEHNQVYAAWQNEPLVLELSEKRKLIAHEAIKVGCEKNKMDTRVSSTMDENHTLILLEAFGYGTDE